MKDIVFFDIEVDPNNKKILDYGLISADGLKIHSNSISEIHSFLVNSAFVCGHNIIKHDLPCIEKNISLNLSDIHAVDTLFLSPLLFPKKPYHTLLKDDKLQTEELNNPLNDAIKAKDLFFDEVTAFQELSIELKQIYFKLLKEIKEFKWFFHYVRFSDSAADLVSLIRRYFAGLICDLKCGDELQVDSNGCSKSDGTSILKFSTSFKERITELEKSGFAISASTINFMVYWKKEDMESEIIIILPEIKFNKKH